MKRVAILILALLLVLPLCAACGNTPVGTEETTPAAVQTTASEQGDQSEESTAEKDTLPEKLNFDTTIHMAHWSDYTMTEFYVEEDNGNGIDSAIFRRNSMIEDRLGITFEYSEAKGASGETAYTTMVRNDYNADKIIDIYASYSRSVPALALEGLCKNLLDTQYFTVEKPWWPKVLTDECTINNKLYFCSGDISTNMLWMMIATFYNKALYENYQSNELFSKTPEQLVRDNEWTMERLFSMTKDVYIDLTGDGASDDDTFGMLIYDVNIDAFQTAAGVTSIRKTNDGGLEINPEWNGQRMQDVVELVGDFLKQQGVRHSDKTSIRKIFNEERALFIMDRTFIVAGKDNASSHDKIEFPFGVIPNPKYSADQPTFLTNMGHPFTTYGIAVGTHNVDAASAALELLGAYSYELVTPEVFENTMKIKYADGAEAAEMYDIIRENVSFDIGRLYSTTFQSVTADQFRKSAIQSPTGFLGVLKSSQKMFRNGINTLTDFFSK